MMQFFNEFNKLLIKLKFIEWFNFELNFQEFHEYMYAFNLQDSANVGSRSMPKASIAKTSYPFIKISKSIL